MRVFITGDAGFIGRNLPASFRARGHSVVNSSRVRSMRETDRGEPCVHLNSKDQWANFFEALDINLVVHNAAIVGTDVVALNQRESTLTNVMGTHNICQAAKVVGIPVCYMGTSVIYDTPSYQDASITETSTIAPSTFYGAHKLAGEHIVKSTVKDWLIMRPLFAYGGVGDMNSLVAKTFYAHKKRKDRIDMFLDPTKQKDYMHVEDFCDAVALACDLGLWGNDYNISAEEPVSTWKIIEKMSGVCGQDLEYMIEWHPDTDYLGNHILSSQKFRLATGWEPRYTFDRGLIKSWRSILSAGDGYNPLTHLEAAQKKGIDLHQFFPKKV